MEVMVEQEVTEDRQELVEWEVRRVRPQQAVPEAHSMLEDLSDITLPLELSLVLGLRVRLRPLEGRVVMVACADFQEPEVLVVLAPVVLVAPALLAVPEARVAQVMPVV